MLSNGSSTLAFDKHTTIKDKTFAQTFPETCYCVYTLMTYTLGSLRNRNNEALSGSLAFVPWILQEAYLQGDVHPETLVLHRGSGAVVFSDASGFTALTERLALKSNGAELLSQCLTSFFTPLIQPLEPNTGQIWNIYGKSWTNGLVCTER